MIVYILFFIFHVIIYGPRVCNKHLNKQALDLLVIVNDYIAVRGSATLFIVIYFAGVLYLSTFNSWRGQRSEHRASITMTTRAGSG